MPVTVKLKNLAQIQQKLGSSVLITPELEAGLETIGLRLERKGKGQGERRNQMNRFRSERLLHRIQFETAHHPRRTGFAKNRKLVSIFESMAPRVARSVLKKIGQRWAQ